MYVTCDQKEQTAECIMQPPAQIASRSHAPCELQASHDKQQQMHVVVFHLLLVFP